MGRLARKRQKGSEMNGGGLPRKNLKLFLDLIQVLRKGQTLAEVE